MKNEINPLKMNVMNEGHDLNQKLKIYIKHCNPYITCVILDQTSHGTFPYYYVYGLVQIVRKYV